MEPSLAGTAAAPSDLAPKSKRGVYALLIANLVSLTGNQITMFALPWFVLERTGSAIQTAMVAATQMVAFLAAAIVGGVVVDRFGPKWLSVVSDIVSGLSIMAIPLLLDTIGLDLWQILALTFFGAVLDSPGNNARFNILTDLLEIGQMPPERVYSAFSTSDGIARIGGPILAGALIASLGAVNALWIDAATFAVSAGLVIVFVPATARAMEAAGSFFGDVRAGWEYLTSRKILVNFFILIVLVNMSAVPLAAVVIPKVARDFYESSRIGGVMLAADGIGVIIGGLLFGFIGRRFTPWRAMFLALLLLALSALTLAGLLPVAVSICALLVTGLGFGIMVPNNQTIYRRITEQQYRGRLLGLRDAVVGISAPVMVITAGLLFDVLPMRAVIFLLACINVTALIWFAADRTFLHFNDPELIPGEPDPQG